MNESTTNPDRRQFDLNLLGALRFGLILLITYWCYRIVAPFIPLLLWGAIIAVATYPLHLKGFGNGRWLVKNFMQAGSRLRRISVRRWINLPLN